MPLAHRHLFVAACTLFAGPAVAADPPSFTHDVMAVLSRAGCNAGACHGNLNGKGGLKLSLRGEDPGTDWATLTRDMLARRVDRLRPAESLMLKKAIGEIPHEGGIRFSKTAPEYAILSGWIAAGCPTDHPDAVELLGLDVTPTHRVLVDPEHRFQLSVTARFANDTTRDVTTLAAYEFATPGVANITTAGEVVREQTGETVLLVRYLDRVVPVRVVFLPDRPIPDIKNIPADHKVDRLVLDQLEELRLAPADLAPDHVFLRRAYLDTLGVLPAVEETRAFLADTRPDKRERLIDDLLARPEFAEHWALKWSDLLRNEVKALDRKGVGIFHRWIAAQVAADRPLTEFARDILAAQGSTYVNAPANFWRAVRDPLVRAESVAQVFLGVRVGCARCHNHPFDRWTMDDYYGFAAFFGRVNYRLLDNTRRDRLDKHEFIGEQVVFQSREGEVVSGRTKKPAKPRFLGTPTPDLGPDGDRLAALADWVADSDNPFFARAQANRVWLHLMGRGLVEPNDDFRATNPATNPDLLDHLAAEFAANEFRLKPLVRHIMTSRTYQLSATSDDPATTADDTHHSRAIVAPLTAEQLLDALARVAGVPVSFEGYPTGLRAGQVPAPPQSGRRGVGGMGEKFLKVFGKPDRLLTCECERSDDRGLLQVFQMINGDVVNDLLADPENRIGGLLAAGTTDTEMLGEFYLAALCRLPTAEEESALLEYIRTAPDRRAAWEDVVWGLVNSKEFLLRR